MGGKEGSEKDDELSQRLLAERRFVEGLAQRQRDRSGAWEKPKGITDEQWGKLEEWEKAEMARTWATEAPQPEELREYGEKAHWDTRPYMSETDPAEPGLNRMLEQSDQESTTVKVPWTLIVSGLVQSLIALAGSPLFLVGYFAHNNILLHIGCACLAVMVVLGLLSGQLRGCVVMVISLILAIYMRPWYVGFLWPQAVFGLTGMPQAILRLAHPRQTGAEAWLQWHVYNPDRYY